MPVLDLLEYTLVPLDQVILLRHRCPISLDLLLLAVYSRQQRFDNFLQLHDAPLELLFLAPAKIQPY